MGHALAALGSTVRAGGGGKCKRASEIVVGDSFIVEERESSAGASFARDRVRAADAKNAPVR